MNHRLSDWNREAFSKRLINWEVALSFMYKGDREISVMVFCFTSC